MVSGSEGELFKSKIDPCGVGERRIKADSVLCMKCGNWVRGKCAKIKTVTARFATRFVCLRCKRIREGIKHSIENLCDEVETESGFCYLEDRPNASGDCKAAVTAREFLLGNRFPLKIKGKIYRCCIRLAIL